MYSRLKVGTKSFSPLHTHSSRDCFWCSFCVHSSQALLRRSCKASHPVHPPLPTSHFPKPKVGRECHKYQGSFVLPPSVGRLVGRPIQTKVLRNLPTTAILHFLSLRAITRDLQVLGTAEQQQKKRKNRIVSAGSFVMRMTRLKRKKIIPLNEGQKLFLPAAARHSHKAA